MHIGFPPGEETPRFARCDYDFHFVAPHSGIDSSPSSTYIDARRRLKGLVEEIQLIRSRPGGSSGGATRRASGPEKTDSFREKLPGFGTAKAVTASGAAMVRAATLLALSQEPVARAQPISQPFLIPRGNPRSMQRSRTTANTPQSRRMRWRRQLASTNRAPRS